MPNLYIISGCNGAGKTTCYFTVLPEMFSCSEFVNADEIAKGLSPFNPDSVQFEAGRIMLKRIRQRVESSVQAGGYNIPVEIIRRRYDRGFNNFKRLEYRFTSQTRSFSGLHLKCAQL